MKKYTAIGVSYGIGIGEILRIVPWDPDIPSSFDGDTDEALDLFNKALEESVDQIKHIAKTSVEKLGRDHAMIFEAHVEIISDPEFTKQIEDKIKNSGLHPAKATREVSDTFANMFFGMQDEYFKQRGSDILDISKRLISNILGLKIRSISDAKKGTILVAEDLTPSDTAQIDKDMINGFITEIGGATSHSSIIAKTLQIPAVAGMTNFLNEVNDGDLVIIDGTSGEVILNPDSQTIEFYEKRMREIEEEKKIWEELKDKEAIALSGEVLEVSANIASAKQIDDAIKDGARGVGLFRTEFLYMDTERLPTEDEQFEAYKKVLEAMKQYNVVIRTLDIGGDKNVSYMDTPNELNPFLGVRAIRLCFQRDDIFRTQLRALIRASIYGKLHIMFPMIATLGDFRRAKRVYLEEYNKLKDSGVEVSSDIKVGIMVEIPSTAVLADRFAKEVDFFSIGTNDLIQYTFAADRLNDNVSYLYQPYNPSIIRLIKNVVDAAHEHNIWAGMCGEMAGDQLAIPLLFGLGLDEYSMSSPSVPAAKTLISKLDKKQCVELVNKAMNVDTNDEVKELVMNFKEKI